MGLNNLSKCCLMMNYRRISHSYLPYCEKIKPNFLVKGGDYSLEDIVGAEFVENNGGQVKIVKLLEGHSSSSLIDKFEN